jgi:hypothetical protein
MNSNLKSIGAVLAGMLVIIILSIVTDAVLERLEMFPPPTQGLFVTWMLALALFYRSLYAIAGGYVTAKLAPANPMKHVLILGLIGTAASIAGVIVGWDLSDHWYPIALVITSLPCVWLGGKFQNKL